MSSELNRRILPVYQPLKRQVLGLDVLRLLSALLVLSWHLGCVNWIRRPTDGAEIMHNLSFLQPLAAYGWLGVEIFFVISGFVVAYSAQAVTAQTFIRRRVYRLWPMAAICASICLAIREWTQPPIFQGGLIRAYILTLLFSPLSTPIEGSFWTLPIEALFYAVIAIVLWRKKLKYLPLIMTVIGAASMTFWLSLTLVADVSASGHGVYWRTLRQLYERNFTLLPHGCFFAVGVLLSELLLRRLSLLSLCGLGISASGCFLEVRFHILRAQDFLRMPLSVRLGESIWFTAVALMIASVLANPVLHEYVSAKQIKMLRAVGLITYPLYLLNERVGTTLMLYFGPLCGYKAALVIALVGLLGLSFVLALEIDPLIQGRLKTRV